MKVVVCDDDVICANEIKLNIEETLREKAVAADVTLFSDSRELMNTDGSFDLAFLDIQMPGTNGIDLAYQLKAKNKNIIIFFITSYDSYLDEAMDLNAFRYIKKPLDIKRLRSGIKKAISYINNTSVTFHLKNEAGIHTINSNEIVYVEIIRHSTKVVTIGGEYISSNTIDYWKDKLCSQAFINVHKSFIINMNHITNYKRDTVTLSGQYQIPIAYRRQAAFRSFFFEYFSNE